VDLLIKKGIRSNLASAAVASTLLILMTVTLLYSLHLTGRKEVVTADGVAGFLDALNAIKGCLMAMSIVLISKSRQIDTHHRAPPLSAYFPSPIVHWNPSFRSLQATVMAAVVFANDRWCYS
jgi:hypothetical protein